MIDCRQCLEGLVDYVYKKLPPNQASAIKEHLSTCAGCREELKLLSYTLRMLDKWEAIEAEHLCLSALKARLRPEQHWGVHQLPSYLQVGVLVSIGIIIFNLLLGVQDLILPPLLARLPSGWQFVQNASTPLLLMGLFLSLGGLLTLLGSPILIMKKTISRSISTGQMGGIPNDKPRS